MKNFVIIQFELLRGSWSQMTMLINEPLLFFRSDFLFMDTSVSGYHDVYRGILSFTYKYRDLRCQKAFEHITIRFIITIRAKCSNYLGFDDHHIFALIRCKS